MTGPFVNGRSLLGAAVFVSALGASALTARPVPVAPPGRLVVEAPHARFDDRYQFDTVVWSWVVRNPGPVAVRITEKVAVQRTGAISVTPETLPPGASGRIEVTQPLADHLGGAGFRYALRTDEPGTPRYRFTLSGFVQSAFDPEIPHLDFGPIDRLRGGRAIAEVASREIERLEILSVDEAPSYLQIVWSRAASGNKDEPLQITATLAPGAPQGRLSATVRLRTNVAQQPLLALQFTAQVFGDVVPQESIVSLGAVRLGETGRNVVRLVSRTGTPFAIAGDDPLSTARVAVRPCAGATSPAPCQEVELRYTPMAPGPFSGVIDLEVVGQTDRLPLAYSGLAIRSETEIRPLEVPGLPWEAPMSEEKP